MEYCTYLTTYRGTKMPMFYIGRSNVRSVQNGYRGSVSSKLYKQVWLEELEQNPHLFETKILTTHATQKEVSASNLKRWHGDNCKLFKIVSDPR